MSRNMVASLAVPTSKVGYKIVTNEFDEPQKKVRKWCRKRAEKVQTKVHKEEGVEDVTAHTHCLWSKPLLPGRVPVILVLSPPCLVNAVLK